MSLEKSVVTIVIQNDHCYEKYQHLLQYSEAELMPSQPLNVRSIIAKETEKKKINNLDQYVLKEKRNSRVKHRRRATTGL